MNRILILIFSLSCVCTSAISIPTQFLISPAFGQQAGRRSEPLSDVEIEKIAKNITVRIFNQDQIKGKECSASGFIVNKKIIKPQDSDNNKPQVYEYQVLTNDHVVNNLPSPYQIQTTIDNKIYQAAIVNYVNFGDNDLALLTFKSSVGYQKSKLGKSSTLQAGNQVFVAGFPGEMSACDKSKFTIKSGVVAPLDFLLNGKTLIEGYAIGYDNDPKRGSSGGPVLNTLGEVVAVNGKGKYSKPPFANAPDPYKFNDNTEPNQNIKLLMTYFSWGIPIETYVKTINPNLSTRESQPTLQEEGKKKYSTSQSSGQETGTENNQGYHPLILPGLGVIIVGLLFVVWKSFSTSNSKESKQQQPSQEPDIIAENPSEQLKLTTEREEVSGDAALTQKTTDEKIEEDATGQLKLTTEREEVSGDVALTQKTTDEQIEEDATGQLKPTTEREKVSGDVALTQKTTDEKIEEDAKYNQLDEILKKMIDITRVTILDHIDDNEKKSIKYTVTVNNNGVKEIYQCSCYKVTKSVNNN